jgi:hypothetical protein
MEQPIAHSGAWGVALIIIVVASWLLYRYLAPKTWKEWASAGVRAGVHGARFFRFSRGPGPAFSGVDGVHLMSSA